MYGARSSFQSPEYTNNPPWQKLLWVKQNYPDNYVDGTFLEELQRNGKDTTIIVANKQKKKKTNQETNIVNVRSYNYWTMVYESGVITQQVSSVVIFIAIFIYLQIHSLSGNHLIWTGSLLTGVGYISWDLIIRSNYEFKRM